MQKKTFYSQDSYRTGDTQPPSGKRWLTLLLMVAVIFLGGLCTGLSLLNIGLFPETSPTTLTSAFPSNQHISQQRPDLYGGDIMQYDMLGLTGQEISTFSRHYYNLPSGIYITAVDERTSLYSSVFPGDIMITIQDEYIENHYQAMTLLEALWDGTKNGWTTDAVCVDVYRQGRIHRLYLYLGGGE